ncbi:MAG: hypothetical protein JWN43_4641 [Gammaproteobacteria bacterium]|nr:hypothetical protein [Gammaproteobacteria bacterium]
MIASRNSTIAAKKDLHVGGLGASAPVGFTTRTDHRTGDRYRQPLQKARVVLQSADTYVRDNFWTAVGLVGFLGLAAGYLLSRRS